MALLDRTNENIIVYHEELVYSRDGNPTTRPSSTGVPTRAMIQLKAQSGTSARRSEQDNEGFETESVYRLRLPRSFPIIGSQAVVEWRGAKWSVVGDVQIFSVSPRTSHVEYTIRRT